jgi:hypothetical protein
MQVVLTINGVVLLIVVLIVGAVLGWNIGVRALISLALFGVIAYLLFVNGGQAVLAFTNNLLAVVPSLVTALTGQSIGGFPTISINIDPGLLARFLGFVFIGVVLPLVVDKIGWPGWQGPPNPKGPDRNLGLLAGVLLFGLYTSVASNLTVQYVQQGGDPSAQFGTPGTALEILPDVGIWPLVLLVLLLGVLFLFNLGKTWSK